MKGKFIGKSSMGFIYGRVYDIRSTIQIVRKGGSFFNDAMQCICIYDNNSLAWCPYESLESLLMNWALQLEV